MTNALIICSRIVGSVIALFCGVVTGAALTIAMIEGGPSVWFTSRWGFGTSEVDALIGGRWVIELQWRFGFMYGVLIAIVALPLWGLAAWRGVNGWRAAMLLGFVLSLGAAMDAVGPQLSAWERAIIGVQIGCAGAIAGLVTLAIDQTLRGKFVYRIVGAAGS